MEKSVDSLSAALGLEPREHLALVGGGGKTSLMFSLAEELCLRNCKVVSTTTTKIWYREARDSAEVLFTGSDSLWIDRLRERVEEQKQIFVARRLLESGKLQGISPSMADEIYQGNGVDYLLVEADGAAGHPVKAPAEKEPVIPSSTTMTVAMLGLEAIGKRLDPETVFRLDLFKELTGLEQGGPLEPSCLAQLFLNPKGLFKGASLSSKRVAFLNKFDLLEEERQTRELAEIIISDPLRKIDRVVIGSLKNREYYPIL